MQYETNPDILNKTKQTQLEILREFDRVCKKHNISYLLYAGTLLGAIRHKGFIPWDDDVDVCMLRRDYEKFLQISEETLDKKYFLQTYETDKEFPHQFAKLRKNNTIFMEGWYANLDIHHGVFIDIFPLDNIEPNTFLGRVHLRLMNYMWRLNTSRFKERNLKNSSGINRIIRMVLYYLLKIVPKKPLDRFITKLSCLYNEKETEWVADLGLASRISKIKKFAMKKEEVEDKIGWNFEGYEFPVPKDYDKILKRNYGDYMTPPPPKERKPHHGIVKIRLNTDDESINARNTKS